MDKIKQYLNTVTDKYLISMSYVEGKPIPTTLEKKYIIYNDQDGSMDYTKDPAAATCFGYILGNLVVISLRKECKDLPNLQFDLITVKDAGFINDVTKEPIEVEEVKETQAA